MFDKTKPMELGDIFNTTFNLVGKTFTRNIIIAAVFFIPTGILFSVGLSSFFGTIANIISETGSMGSRPPNITAVQGLEILAKGILFFITFLVFLFGYLAVWIGVTKTAVNEMEGDRISIGDIFRKIFSVTYFRSLGLHIFFTLVYLGIFIIPVVLLIAGSGTHNVFFKVFGVLTFFPALIFIFYLTYLWYFAFVNLVAADEGIIDSVRKSTFLVRGYWWRTFGILLLISIAVNFAVSIISTPISFLFMWDFISGYIGVLTKDNLNNDPVFIAKFLKSFGLSFGMIIIFTTILESLINPLFNVAMYYDLKIRKHDFTEEIIDQPKPEDNLNIEEPPIG